MQMILFYTYKSCSLFGETTWANLMLPMFIYCSLGAFVCIWEPIFKRLKILVSSRNDDK